VTEVIFLLRRFPNIHRVQANMNLIAGVGRLHDLSRRRVESAKCPCGRVRLVYDKYSTVVTLKRYGPLF
jgi:hypothetical protein